MNLREKKERSLLSPGRARLLFLEKKEEKKEGTSDNAFSRESEIDVHY